MISENQLKLIAPTMSEIRCKEIAPKLNSICPIYGINTVDIFEDFLANILTESGEFSVFTENLDYSVDGLINTFGTKRISKAQAQAYGRTKTQKANQVQIANTVYGGAWGLKNLGNTQPFDGFDLRGSGAMQLTGRTMIDGFKNYYNKINKTNYTTTDIASLLRTNIDVSIHGACWVFAIEKKLIDEAIADDIKAVRRGINGGYNGLDKIIVYTDRCKRVLY